MAVMGCQGATGDWEMSEAIKCGMCGRFTSYEKSDQYAPFGSCADIDPPEIIFMCPKCSKEDEEDQIKSGIPWSNWIVSQSSKNAAKKLGYWLAGPKGAAWATFYKLNKPLPEGYVWREQDTPEVEK